MNKVFYAKRILSPGTPLAPTFSIVKRRERKGTIRFICISRGKQEKYEKYGHLHTRRAFPSYN